MLLLIPLSLLNSVFQKKIRCSNANNGPSLFEPM
ncbi:hypothetical protein BCE_3200 [Bacillus cereus ATCC 10987]|uniref:Uncharacterized protein n=1 Tax=Bacillus cereus (strain ATCC 10987 / NRS 248) TaxID=222523 RepID=Q735F2_BACC1|nr:hypothetical protein BCE_3200 [Bacillus cereus ATCC 10987]